MKMKVIIVLNSEQITSFNEDITPLMMAAGQIMHQWVDEEQCPVNSKTGEIAIITEAEGIRRQIIEKYISDNNLCETELSYDNEDWFPKINTI